MNTINVFKKPKPLNLAKFTDMKTLQIEPLEFTHVVTNKNKLIHSPLS